MGCNKRERRKGYFIPTKKEEWINKLRRRIIVKKRRRNNWVDKIMINIG